MEPFGHRSKLAVADPTAQAEGRSAAPEPFAGRLRTARVVVLDATRDAGRAIDAALRLLQVVVSLAGRELSD